MLVHNSWPGLTRLYFHVMTNNVSKVSAVHSIIKSRESVPTNTWSPRLATFYISNSGPGIWLNMDLDPGFAESWGQILSPWLGDIVDFGRGLSNWPPSYSAACPKFDMVWLHCSPIPVGRKWVISSLKWFLPTFAIRKGSRKGVGTLWDWHGNTMPESTISPSQGLRIYLLIRIQIPSRRLFKNMKFQHFILFLGTIFGPPVSGSGIQNESRSEAQTEQRFRRIRYLICTKILNGPKYLLADLFSWVFPFTKEVLNPSISTLRDWRNSFHFKYKQSGEIYPE